MLIFAKGSSNAASSLVLAICAIVIPFVLLGDATCEPTFEDKTVPPLLEGVMNVICMPVRVRPRGDSSLVPRYCR